MSAPTTLVTASAYASPPSTNKQYGKGSFLVGFWGEATKYSLDGQIWYEHPKQYEWAKGNCFEHVDTSANDNDKTISDFGLNPVFIDYISIVYTTTGTSGNRDLIYTLRGSATDHEIRFQDNLSASNTIAYLFAPIRQHDFDSTNKVIPFIFCQPNWASIRIHDRVGVDSNDDFTIHILGTYALPNYHWIEFKNCKNFQIQNFTESLADGIFTSGSSIPRSVKILKI